MTEINNNQMNSHDTDNMVGGSFDMVGVRHMGG